MEHGTLTQLVNTAKRKKKMVDETPHHYLIRAALAGIYIGFALILSFELAQPFYEQQAASTSFINAIFFGIAFCLIIYGGTELFTSNTMYMTISSLKKETSWIDTLKVWLFCYAGNVIGILFFTLMIYFAGIFHNLKPDNSLLMSIAETKMNLPTSYLFFRAILANWLVCLAVWLPMQVKDDFSKIVLMILLVFTFFISGYEHSIANITLFSIALSSPHTALVSIEGVIHNIIPVTIGNIIGGGFFVGAVYAYLNTKKKESLQHVRSIEHVNSGSSQTTRV